MLATLPYFISSNAIGGDIPHTDVNLWYIFRGDSRNTFSFDRREFKTIEWFTYDTIPFHRAEDHLKRFMKKLFPILNLSSQHSYERLTTKS